MIGRTLVLPALFGYVRWENFDAVATNEREECVV